MTHYTEGLEFRDSRDVDGRGRLTIEPSSLGRLTCGSLSFRVHRVADAGPYQGDTGRPVCVLTSRRHARYLVMETRAGRLIVFNIGERRSHYTPWSKTAGAPFGVIDRADLAVFASSLRLDGAER